MSPVSVTTDRLDMSAEYADHGIPHFLRVEDDDEPAVFRSRLDGGTYALAGVDVGRRITTEPVGLPPSPGRLR